VPHDPSEKAFRGFQVGGGFAKGHRPDDCGSPRTGNRTGWSRLEHRESKPCEICFRPARPSRRYCNSCRQVDQRTGDPRSRSQFQLKWIAREVADVLRLIQAIKDHPKTDEMVRAKMVLANAETWIRAQLERCRGYELVGYRPGMSAKLRQQRRLGNLANAGIIPDRILALVAGFYVAREVLPNSFYMDRHWYTQTGRAVCLMAALPQQTYQPPFKDEGVMVSVAEPLGRLLVKHVGDTAGSLAEVIMTGRPFGAIPALTAGFRPPSKLACAMAIKKTMWRPREE
jgi:hypothetical protein